MATKITPTLAAHMIAVYHAMEEDSQEQEGYKVYVGRLAELVRGLGISMTYYSRLFRALYEGGYAALEDRGGRNKPSTVILMREPTVEELTALTLTNPGPILSLIKRVEALEASTGGMYIAGALQEFERRVRALEDQARKTRSSKKE